MIRLPVVPPAGVAVGYSHGYLPGDAGEDSIIRVALAKVGLGRSVSEAQRAVQRAPHGEARRQAVLDSFRQARADSIASLVHH
ncbi:MAG: hypothetical protein JWL60_1887 [Gemmatimonadetes bacterium]|jgi:hypothetical protein|nr:hypothetical protein [Gemmatimonadota bacterium]